MRKVKILRTLVDIIWILTLLGFVIAIGFVLFYFTNMNISDNFKINKIEIFKLSKFHLFLFLLLSSFNLLLYYCFYLFRKIVHSFDDLKIFSDTVIKNFSRIGVVLIIIGVANTINSFLATILFQQVNFSFELNWNSIGLIALGLFCSVLSEIFKVSKNLKQENDLTI